MRRLVLAIVAVCVVTLPVTAQKKQPKACAIFVRADGNAIADPAPVTCEQDGSIGVVFCNDDKASGHTMTLKKDMKTPAGALVQILAADITKFVRKTKCDFRDGKVLPSASIDHYRYTLTSGKLSLDPDLDVAPPSGIEPKGAARGRGAR